MVSANLTLRQRQQQRRAEEEPGNDATGSLSKQRPVLPSAARPLSPPGRKSHKQRRPTASALASMYAGVSIVFLTLCLTMYAQLSPWYLGSLVSIPQLRRRNSSFIVEFSIVINNASEKKRLRGLCVPPTVFKSKEEFLSEHELLPDLNGLIVSSLSGSSEFMRVIRIDRDQRLFSHDRMKQLEAMNAHPGGVGRRYEDDFEYSLKHECRRNNWRSRKLPNCNSAHELFNLDRTNEYDTIEFKGAGAYRNSWLFESKSDQFVVKSLRFKSSLNADYSMMYQIHKEAIVMERLTASPRIVDIFGYCGTTVVAEYMNRQITGDIVWGSEDWEGYAGWMKQEDLDKLQTNDVHPMNNLTIDEKLDLAIVMAESIADIHGFEGGVIVHGDVHPIQWLQNPKGEIKLNDFNNGEILDFYPTDNEYCKIYRCYGGTYRSPEEFRCIDSHEAMDTYSMGNNIYILLVGLWPFYQYEPDNNSRAIQNKLIEDTERPYIDPRYRTRSEIEGGLVKIMEQCWEWDMDKRLSIFDVVRQLHNLRDRVRSKPRLLLASGEGVR